MDGTANRCGAVDEKGEAIKGDYEAVDQILTFEKGTTEQFVIVKIMDDNEWEPDEDFYIELYDPESKKAFPEADCKTTVTIIDDDRPGTLAFECHGSYKHVHSDPECQIKILRLHACDGKISCKYRTFQLTRGRDTATDGEDYTHVEDILEFGDQEKEQIIRIPILPRKDGEENRHLSFGLEIFDPEPVAVKISKKNKCIIEIVADAEAKR